MAAMEVYGIENRNRSAATEAMSIGIAERLQEPDARLVAQDGERLVG